MQGRISRHTDRRHTVKLSPSRQVIIPKPLCEELQLGVGDLLEGTVEEGRVVLTPQALIDRWVKTAIEDFSINIPLPATLRAALRRA